VTRGKKARQMRVDRSAEREAARRKQRQQTLFTSIVVAVVLLIGGVLIYVSAQDPAADLAESPTEAASDLASEGASEAASEDARAVACGAEAPAGAGEEKQTYDKPEQVLEDGKDYRATITTSCGVIEVDLYEEDAPETVNSFVFLAQEGFFDGLEIFRNAASIGALQTGSGTNQASFDVGYNVKDELARAEQDGYEPGTLAMANTGQPNSGGSQFFFVYNDKFTLPPTYAVFGKADAKGTKVLEEIGDIPTQAPDDPANEVPSELVYIESVEITTE
jgi:peptidyl-prolyl cis-trans isomerase B (cyclophilin B)